jgi:hypothetical protein
LVDLNGNVSFGEDYTVLNSGLRLDARLKTGTYIGSAVFDFGAICDPNFSIRGIDIISVKP